MERRNIHQMTSHMSHLSRDTRGLFMESKEISRSGCSSNESQDLFRETFEKMQLPSSSTSELYSQMLQKRDEQVSKLLMSSTASHVSRGSFSEFNDHEFLRSSSESSDWTNFQLIPPVNRVPKLPSVHFTPGFSHNRRIFPRFGSFGGFSGFNPPEMSASLNEGEKQTNSFWSFNGNSQTSTSTIEYRMQMSSSYSWSDQGMQQQNSQELELYADSESDSDEDEIFGCNKQAIDACSENDTCSVGTLELEPRADILAIEASPPVDTRKERAWRLANELLTTEESYVKVLHLIDQIFYFRVDQENRAHSMFPQEMIPQMFSNLKSIYKFHNEFLLPQLKSRMMNWEKDPRIGDIMKNFAPFLKMYTEYVKNFDNAMNIINALATKNRRFSDLMNEIHKMEECGGLTLSHHMLSPIQRIPRYELLLKDYLKKLTDDSIDREDTEKALHLVSTAANHANEMMKKIDKFKHLLELQEEISGVVDLVSPTRELIKEGKMIKISARSGDHQERYLFLFSDYLFLCSTRFLPNRVISGPAYRLRAKFALDNMQWCEGDNLETTNTFYVRDNSKNIELYTQTSGEKSSWRDAFLQAIQELYKRKSSLKIGTDIESELGKRAPNLITMDGVTRCMECRSNFGVMKRKHHCRACGLVFCSKCSGQKYPLPFEGGKPCRVCKNCHQLLGTLSNTPSPDRSPDTESDGPANTNSIHMAFSREKGVLEVRSDAPCVHSGFLQLKTHGKSWIQRWFSLHPDFVLYSFLTNSDQNAMTATPVPGFTISRVTHLKGESVHDKEKMFKMYHSKKTYYFQATSKEDVGRWIRALEMSSQAQLPSPEKKSG